MSGYSDFIREQQRLAAEEQQRRLQAQNAKLAAIRLETVRRRREQEKRLAEQKADEQRQRQLALQEHKRRLQEQNELGSSALRAIKQARRRASREPQSRSDTASQHSGVSESMASEPGSDFGYAAQHSTARADRRAQQPSVTLLPPSNAAAAKIATVQRAVRTALFDETPAVTRKYELAASGDLSDRHRQASDVGIRVALDAIYGPALHNSIMAHTPKALAHPATGVEGNFSFNPADANRSDYDSKLPTSAASRSIPSLAGSMDGPLTAGARIAGIALVPSNNAAAGDVGAGSAPPSEDDGYLSARAIRDRSLMLQVEHAWKKHVGAAAASDQSNRRGRPNATDGTKCSELFRESVLARSLDRFVEQLYGRSANPAEPSRHEAAVPDDATSENKSADCAAEESVAVINSDQPQNGELTAANVAVDQADDATLPRRFRSLPTILESTAEFRQSLESTPTEPLSLFALATAAQKRAHQSVDADTSVIARRVNNNHGVPEQQHKPQTMTANADTARSEAKSHASSGASEALNWRAKVQQIKRKMSLSGRASPAARSDRSTHSAGNASLYAMSVASEPLVAAPTAHAATASAASANVSTSDHKHVPSRVRARAPWAKSPPPYVQSTAQRGSTEQSPAEAVEANGLFADHLERMRGGSAPVKHGRRSAPVVARHDLGVKNANHSVLSAGVSTATAAAALHDAKQAVGSEVAVRGAEPNNRPALDRIHRQPDDGTAPPQPIRSTSPLSRKTQTDRTWSAASGQQRATRARSSKPRQARAAHDAATVSRNVFALTLSVEESKLRLSLAKLDERLRSMRKRAMLQQQPEPSSTDQGKRSSQLSRKKRDHHPNVLFESSEAAVANIRSDGDVLVDERKSRHRVLSAGRPVRVATRDVIGCGTFTYLHPAERDDSQMTTGMPQSQARVRIGIGPQALVRGRQRKSVGRAYLPAAAQIYDPAKASQTASGDSTASYAVPTVVDHHQDYEQQFETHSIDDDPSVAVSSRALYADYKDQRNDAQTPYRAHGMVAETMNGQRHDRGRSAEQWARQPADKQWPQSQMSVSTMDPTQVTQQSNGRWTVYRPSMQVASQPRRLPPLDSRVSQHSQPFPSQWARVYVNRPAVCYELFDPNALAARTVDEDAIQHGRIASNSGSISTANPGAVAALFR